MNEAHKARMANRKLARQNMKPAPGIWMYKVNRAGKIANAVQQRIDGLRLSVDLGRGEDRSIIGYNYLECVR